MKSVESRMANDEESLGRASPTLRRSFPQNVTCREDRAVRAAKAISPTHRIRLLADGDDARLTHARPAGHRSFHANVTLDVSRHAKLRDEAHHPLRAAGVHHEIVGLRRIRLREGVQRSADVSPKPQRSIIGADDDTRVKGREFLRCGSGPRRSPIGRCVAAKRKSQEIRRLHAAERRHRFPRRVKRLRQPQHRRQADAAGHQPRLRFLSSNRKRIPQRSEQTNVVSDLERFEPTRSLADHAVDDVDLDGVRRSTKRGDAVRAAEHRDVARVQDLRRVHVVPRPRSIRFAVARGGTQVYELTGCSLGESIDAQRKPVMIPTNATVVEYARAFKRWLSGFVCEARCDHVGFAVRAKKNFRNRKLPSIPEARHGFISRISENRVASVRGLTSTPLCHLPPTREVLRDRLRSVNARRV